MHFIHCILPNIQKEYGKFVDELVLRQLMTSSTIAYAQFIRFGYSKHVALQKIINQCKQLEEKLKIPFSVDSTNLYLKVLLPIGFGPEDFKMGNDLILFRSNKIDLLEKWFSDAKATPIKKLQQPVASPSKPEEKRKPK